MAKYYTVMRSYSVVERHDVEAASPDEAIALIEGGEEDYFTKSYDGEYDKGEDGKTLYEIDQLEEV